MWTYRRTGIGGQRSGGRREWLRSGRQALLVIAFFLSPIPCSLTPAFAAGTRYEVREVKPQVFVWIPEDIIEEEGDPDFTRAGNAGFIATNEGVVVVNTTNSPFHARELLYEIRRRTTQPVKYVVDTNATNDLVLGNEVFLDLQATILATSGVQDQMREREQELVRRESGNFRLQRRMRGIHVKLPNQIFQGEMHVTLGGKEIRLASVATGSSDSTVYLPVEKVLFLGDLFDNGYFPHLEPPAGSQSPPRDVHRWIEVLRQVEGWDAEVYVPAHGEPGGKKELADFRQFLEWLSTEVKNRIKEGKPLDQTKRELLPLLENYHWHAPELTPALVEAVYRQSAADSPNPGGNPEPSAPGH